MKCIRAKRYFVRNKGLDEAAEMNLSSLWKERKLLEKTNEELRSKDGKQKIVVERNVRKMLKSVATCFIAIEMCIMRAIPKYSSREMYEIECSSKDLRWN